MGTDTKLAFKEKRRKALSNYLSDKSDANLEILIKTYQSLVGYLAHDLWAPHPYISVEDMFQVGMIGFLKGLKNLDITRVKSVDAWFSLNIKSQMYDAYKYNRAYQWSPDGIVPGSIEKILEEKGDFLELLLSYQDDLDMRITISDALLRLEPRDADLITKVYFEDKEQKKLAEEWKISEVRMCQLHRRALERLRPYLWLSLNWDSSLT